MSPADVKWALQAFKTSYNLDNEEFGAPISVCRKPRLPLEKLWPHLKAFQ
ncbi:MAG: hypothetical protein ACHQ0J_05820 [Candidatus Dormibacterales bacterium]